MEAMAKHRTHSVAFKRQVAQEFLGGVTLHGLANRHELSRNLIRIWVKKYGSRPATLSITHIVVGSRWRCPA
jgi:transposase-like protein